jgi:pyruvate dehydrogenase E2 component (dihydrolipoamide acetyltransferase)
VETAKALVDIPSPYPGTVERLHAQPGETIPVGAPLISIGQTGAAQPSVAAAAAPDEEAHGPVLVGYGTGGPGTALTRRRRISGGGNIPSTAIPAGSIPGVVAPGEHSAPAAATSPTPAISDGPIAASPLVRKMADARGIDLRTIQGTGPGGRIRAEDLEMAQLGVVASGGRPAPSAGSPPRVGEGLGERSDEPGDERISTVGLRKAIAARMLRAATTIPHFTEYGLFDATALVALRQRLKADPRFAGQHLTYLPFFVRALVAAVREHRILNSRWDEEGNAIVVRGAMHVGIATDTERGLLVPVIHGADTLDLAATAAEAERLVGIARTGKLDAKSMTGGTITITNVGAAGPVDTGAPLINPPEACVVGFGAIKPRPTVVGDQVLVRPGCWISISCDHRIVDGATAAAFLGALVRQLEAPDGLVDA